jgi:hypothetical protein
MGGFFFSSSWVKGIGVGWVAGRIVFDAWVDTGKAENVPCHLEAVDFHYEGRGAESAGENFKARMQEDGFSGFEKCEGWKLVLLVG